MRLRDRLWIVALFLAVAAFALHAAGGSHTLFDNALAPSGVALKNVQPGLDTKAPFINVKAAPYFAVGDGSDDTVALNAASASGSPLYFPAGTYSVTNLTHGTAPWVGVPRQSIIRARAGGDATYLVASPKWLEASATTASAPWGTVDGVDFDGNGLKTYTVALRSYFNRFKNAQFYGATDTDFLVSSDAQDGTLLSSTLVNNKWENCWFGVDGATASYGLRVVDTNGKVTDGMVQDSWFSGHSVVNIWVPISSGWKIVGNHFYGSGTSSMYVYKPNVGTVVAHNYLEKEARFGSSNTSATTPFAFGPGNFFSSNVWADFNNTGNYIVSAGNVYGSSAELRHAFFDPTKVMVSVGDTFGKSAPFTHYSSAGGSIQNASTGKFRVVGSFLTAIGRSLNVLFDGSGAAGSVMHKPASFDSVLYEPLDHSSATGAGTITLASASPSTGTATVQTGARCVCTNQTTQANAIKCAVSGTTLTATGPNTVTDVVTYLCF